MNRAVGLVALVVLVGLAAVVVLTGCGAPAPTASAAPAAPAAAAAPAPTGSAAPAAVPTPARVRIPAIGVDSDVVDLGVDGSGALVPPQSADVAGWFAGGPAPGASGPALLAGHVDSRTGPGVFYRLADLRPGDPVEVGRADGSVVRFTVSRVFQTPKAAFPTALVYAPVPGPELRLVTCGGTFDRSIGHYRDNVVVEAVPADSPGWTID
jgi:sortase (surface protein transpeptidase)